ncbi:MAG: hypothetical protein MK100_03780 [Phycisphaerales bacterium]|nr:hypothetical protein [Phycisphaerales bacterium]
MESAALCMECATVTTPVMTLPVGLMAVAAVAVGVSLFVVRRLRMQVQTSVLCSSASC